MLFIAANASGATLFELDDTAVTTDRGASVSAYFVPQPFDQGPATGYATFRRFVQSVQIGGDATVEVTPMADGLEYPSQKQTVALAVASGTLQPVEAPFLVGGTRFQAKVAVTSRSSTVEFGESDQQFVPRRTSRLVSASS